MKNNALKMSQFWRKRKDIEILLDPDGVVLLFFINQAGGCTITELQDNFSPAAYVTNIISNLRKTGHIFIMAGSRRLAVSPTGIRVLRECNLAGTPFEAEYFELLCRKQFDRVMESKGPLPFAMPSQWFYERQVQLVVETPSWPSP